MIKLVLQQNRLRWYGHVSRKDENDWREDVIRQLQKEDAMDI